MSVTREELKAFVKSKEDYYTLKWSNMKAKNTIFSWNWSSFIFGPLWMLYRRLYLIGFSVLIIYIGIYGISSYLVNKEYISDLVYGYSLKAFLLFFIVLIFYIFLAFLWGKLGNYLYYRKIEVKCRNIKRVISDFDQQKSELNRYGGTIFDLFRDIQAIPLVVTNTIFPLVITVTTVVFTIVVLDLKFIKNFEYQVTDAAKFAIKDHINTNVSDGPYDWVDSPIIILGISESSQFNYLNSIFGQYPWPREVYGDFLSYFRLTDKRLIGIPDINLDEVKQLTWNSISPKIVFFDIFFDAKRDTKISFNDSSFNKDFGTLLEGLRRTGNVINHEDIIKGWAKSKREESDNKFIEELKRHKGYNNVFVDYPVDVQTKGRLKEEEVKRRVNYLLRFELKDVYDRNGAKIEVPLDYNPNFSYPPIGYDIKAPLINIIKNTAGTGPANILSDPDGKRRKMPLIYRIYDDRFMVQPVFMPTIDLIMSMNYFNVKPDNIKVELGKAITLKNAMIRKPIKYTRGSLSDDNRVYRWGEYIDEFMDYIITKIVDIAKVKKQDNNFKLNYNELLTRLLGDKKLKNLLRAKYKRNNIDIGITSGILKKEIDDFLMSLTETSLSKYLGFFLVENRRIKDIDLDMLKGRLVSLKEKSLVLSNFIQKRVVQQGELKRKVDIMFTGSDRGKIAFRDFKAPRSQYHTMVALLVSNKTINDEEFFRIRKELSDNKLIELDSGSDIPGIKFIDRQGIDKYYKSLSDKYSKDVVEFIITYDDIRVVIERLKDAKLMQYNEKAGEFITFTDLQQLEVLKRSLKDKRQVKIIEYIFNFTSPNENQLTRDSKELYHAIASGLKVNEDTIKKTLNLLSNNKLVAYPVYSYITIEDIDKLIKYRDNPHKTKNPIHKKVITKLIEGLSSSIDSNLQGYNKFYILKTDNVLSYLIDKTKLDRSRIKDILSKAYAKIDYGRQDNVIKINSKDIQVSNPRGILDSINEIKVQQKVISRLIELTKGGNNSLYYYNTLVDIAKETKINSSLVELAITNIIIDSDEAPYKVSFIKKGDMVINGNVELIKTYNIVYNDIAIPIDEIGQMVINYQGYHRSFENDHFGKYMGLSRERYINNRLPAPYSLGYEKEAPAFNWERFKNKIIFIGFYTTFGLGETRDYFETPYSTIFGIEIHANALNTIISQDFITHLNKNIVLIGDLGISYEHSIMFLFALIFGMVLPRLTILRGFLFFFTVTFFYIFFNFLYVFSELKVDIPLVGTILTMVFCFITLTVYKLMTEEKEKRKIKGMFSKYVSADMVNIMVESNRMPELGGEYRVLTVLFSDIRGFTSLSEGLPPNELVDHLNIYLSEMSDIVTQYKGTVDKYIGDALMAFWGAPLEIEDHAILACKAALRMNERLEELNNSWPSSLNIRIGIGLNTGTMTVGNMGSTQRMDYTIMGDPVNLGSRVEGANKVYKTELIITEYTYELVKDHVIARELDFVIVKGKAKPVKIYELLAIR